MKAAIGPRGLLTKNRIKWTRMIASISRDTFNVSSANIDRLLTVSVGLCIGLDQAREIISGYGPDSNSQMEPGAR